MNISYRSLNESDYDRIIAVWNAAGLPTRTRGRDSRENIASQISDNPEFFIGAFDGNSLIGLVIASSDGRKGWINRLATLPEYRHRGIAKKLIKLAEEAMYKSGVEIISCLIFRDNRPSIGLFESEGYSCREDVLYLRKTKHDDV